MVIVFYAITQIIYNAGLNTMIFVLAAEIFPTVYRGTFYGIAAATGKVGAIIIRSITLKVGDGHKALAIRLLAFGPLMLVAALISWYLPDVQYLLSPSRETRRHQRNVEPGQHQVLFRPLGVSRPIPLDWLYQTPVHP